MGIRSFFHKIKIGFVRRCENSIPYVSSTKRYGNNGEDEFAYLVKNFLPACRIKRNIVIETADGNAEIDCLLLYQNKIFAIEVKRWKGRLIETENGFIQEKTDRWTGEKHHKILKSPFKQLNRAVYLLKKSIPSAVWINSIVFFEDKEFERIETTADKVWFSDIKQLTKYILDEGKAFNALNAERFFDRCVAADYIYAKSWDKSLHCIIDERSLRFQTLNGEINRKQIRFIKINHHWSYDELNITLIDGTTCYITQENAKINVRENGRNSIYAMCKLDYIKLGGRDA